MRQGKPCVFDSSSVSRGIVFSGWFETISQKRYGVDGEGTYGLKSEKLLKGIYLITFI